MGCLFEFLMELIGVFSVNENKKMPLFVRIILAFVLFVLCIGTVIFTIFVIMNSEDLSMKYLLIAVAVFWIIFLIVLIIKLIFNK